MGFERTRRARCALAAAAAATLTLMSVGTSTVQAVDPAPWNWLWIGPTPASSWFTPGNWAPINSVGEALPNSSNSFVYIDPSMTVGVNTGTASASIPAGNTATVGAAQLATGTLLDVGAGSEFRVTPGSFAGSGVINNNGEIKLNGSNLALTSGALALNGTGTLTLTDDFGNQIYSNANGSTLTVGSNATIRGAGRISTSFFAGTQGNLNLINQGLIDATGTTNPLRLQPSAAAGAGVTNTGTLRASGGGTLEIRPPFDATTINNTGGTIQALANSSVRIGNFATISGGTLTTTGTGAIRGMLPGGGGGTLLNVTNNGNVVIADNEILGFSGTLANNGNVKVESTGSGARMRIDGNTTINGTGIILLSDNGGNVISATTNGTSLTISAGATIEGAGAISDSFFAGTTGNTNVINQGLIHATKPGNALRLRPNAAANAGLTNTGTLRASNGATLQIVPFAATVINNTGGTIEALNNSFVRIGNDATISGGIITSAGTGRISGMLPGGGGGTLSGLTNNGNVLIADNEILNFVGTINNNGTIDLQSSGNATTMRLAAPVTLNGTGVVSLSTNNFANFISASSAGTTLTLGATATLQGAGTIGPSFSTAVNIVNNGLITANTAGGNLQVNTDGGSSANTSNAGTLRADTGTMTFGHFGGPGAVTNTGVIEAINGGKFNAQSIGLTNRTGGTLTGGTYRALGTGADVSFSSGSISTLAANTEVVIGGAGIVRFASTSIESTLTSNAGTVRLFDTRTLNVSNPLNNSGLLQARDNASVIAVNGVLTSSGTLTGDGSINATTLNISGEVEPGNSPGSLTLNGNVALSAPATLEFELGSLVGPNDLIDVNGNLVLDGTVNVTALPGFGIGTYQLISFSGLLTDNGLTVGVLPAGYTGSIFIVPSVGAIDGSVNLGVVPEPSAFAPIGAAFAASVLRRRRGQAGRVSP